MPAHGFKQQPLRGSELEELHSARASNAELRQELAKLRAAAPDKKRDCVGRVAGALAEHFDADKAARCAEIRAAARREGLFVMRPLKQGDRYIPEVLNTYYQYCIAT